MISTIYVDGVSAVAAKSERLTSGRVGMPVALILDAETWANLDCLVSVRGSGVVRNAIFAGSAGTGAYADRIIGSITVPHDCMTQPYSHLLIGIRGVREENGTTVEVIPSIYCDLGVIEQGASDAGEGDSDYEKSLIEQLLAAAQEAQAIAQSVRDDADAGEFDGPAGPQGERGEKGEKGDDYNLTEADKSEIAGMVQKGADGYSPTVAVEAVEGGYRVTITDKNGPHTYTALHGERGEQGIQGPAGERGERGETGPQGERGIQGEQGIQGVQGIQGPAGERGSDGDDGVSPTVSVSTITGGHRVTITDAAGTHTVDVMDGSVGPQGPAGSDYTITQADYNAIAQVVLDSLDDADEGAY